MFEAVEPVEAERSKQVEGCVVNAIIYMTMWFGGGCIAVGITYHIIRGWQNEAASKPIEPRDNEGFK